MFHIFIFDTRESFFLFKIFRAREKLLMGRNPTCEELAQKVKELEHQSHGHKQIEEELKKSQEQLSQTQKNEVPGNLGD